MNRGHQHPKIQAPVCVLYHDDCADGFGAAWAIWKRFPHAQFHPVKHGYPPPDGLEDHHVVIADFSYGRDIIEGIAKKTASLCILDHHVTAQEALTGLPYAHFDLDRSGAVLAWEWAHDEPLPWLLQYIQDKDLWQWQLPNSREINAALGSYPYDFPVWDGLRQEVLEVEGRGILRYENMLVKKITGEAVMITLHGERVPAVYSPMLTSQIGEVLSRDHPFCVIWHQRDGRRYFSLRSQANGVSVAKIAAHYGGGGHTHAAGFSVSLDQAESPILDPLQGLTELGRQAEPSDSR
jgi:oligoribonuclease NrnB/cAMP/cGMP phosphodiesterase (DHH superfamily)